MIDLVVPLPHEGTAMRSEDTAGSRRDGSGAVAPVIGRGLRRGDVDSTNGRGWPPSRPGRGTRTSTTATRTTTTRTTTTGPAPSADGRDDAHHAGLSFEALVEAYFDCRRTKRNTASALAFEADLERNLVTLFDELAAGAYRPGPSICFVVTRPKPREVWAAQFRDRVVHHLLYNRVGERFERAFIADSCACIKGRGTLYAARRLEAKVRSVTRNWSRRAYYLKADVANFFVAIDRRVLAAQLEARIRRLTALLGETTEPAPLLRRLEELEGERRTAADEVARAEAALADARVVTAITEADVAQLLAGMAGSLAELPREALKDALRGWLSRVELDPVTRKGRVVYRLFLARDNVASPRRAGGIPAIFAEGPAFTVRRHRRPPIGART